MDTTQQNFLKKENYMRTKIHNVRFYDLQPRRIQRISIWDPDQKLALARNDGCIELWDINHAPVLLSVITELPENAIGLDYIEDLVWGGENRLFAVGLGEYVTEYNPYKCAIKNRKHTTGMGIWCVAVTRNLKELAVGTENGYVNIFSIENDKLNRIKLFDKQKDSILCCNYSRNGDKLVTGSVNTVIIWDVGRGQALHKMTLPKQLLINSPVKIRAVRYLSNGTVIAGDSIGRMTVWDASNGSIIEMHQPLLSDILDICVDETEDNIILSGVDPVIRIYKLTKIKHKDTDVFRWVRSLHRSVHDHDVKTLACNRGKIFSGGVDGYLGVSPLSRTLSTIEKYGPFLTDDCASVSPEERIVLLRYPKYLEIWRLNDVEFLTDNWPEVLLKLSSVDNDYILSAAISRNACMFCYSTERHTIFYRYELPIQSGSKIVLKSANNIEIPVLLRPVSFVLFTNSSDKLILLSNRCDALQVVNTSICAKNRFFPNIVFKKRLTEHAKLVRISKCDKYIVIAGITDNIITYEKNIDKAIDIPYKYVGKLPKYGGVGVITALTLWETRLLVAYSSGRIVEFDAMKLTLQFIIDNTYHPTINSHAIHHLEYQLPYLENRIILHNDHHIICLDILDDIHNSTTLHKKDHNVYKLLKMGTNNEYIRCLGVKDYQHLLHYESINRDEAVAIGVYPTILISELPPGFALKKSGAS